jgi:thiamine-phosphate pyrophosphorylase
LSERSAFPRLYAILDTDLTSRLGLKPLEVLDAWLTAGIRLVQLRAKTTEGGPMLELADRMMERIRRAGGTFIVNDRADIAQMSGADGVHVGQLDLGPRDARTVVGDTSLIGLSTHDADQLSAGAREAVTYLAMGPVFSTQTKGPSIDPTVGLEGVRRAAGVLRGLIPLVAIGGITIERAPDVLAAGATSVAVISDLLTGRLEDRARTFLAAVA